MADQKERAKRRLAILSGHLKPCSASVAVSCPPTYAVRVPEQHLFKYTLDNSILTTKQREFYEKNGFLVMKNLVSPEKLQLYRDRFQEICDSKKKPEFMTIMRDVTSLGTHTESAERVINKLQDFQLDPILSDYCKLPDILKYVECFTGPDIMAIHTMLINKPPDPGTKTSRHPLHQDLHYFPIRPADWIVCSWTAMEHVHKRNGCLVVLPGSHVGTLLEHEYPNWEGGVNKFYHGIHDFDPNAPRLHLEMDAGDTVFFHPILIHGSGANTTSGFRKAISTHYASNQCHYIDVKGTTQENIEQEVVALIRKRLGDDIKVNLQDAFKIRNMLVQGKEGTLSI